MADTQWQDRRVVVSARYWEPMVHLEEGLRRTIHWYAKTHARKGYVDEKVLMERSV